MKRKTRARRHCLSPRGVGPPADVPGLTQVLSAIDLLERTAMTRVVVSVPRGRRDVDLIALSREAAAQNGIQIEAESQGLALVLRFSRSAPR